MKFEDIIQTNYKSLSGNGKLWCRYAFHFTDIENAEYLNVKVCFENHVMCNVELPMKKKNIFVNCKNKLHIFPNQIA